MGGGYETRGLAASAQRLRPTASSELIAKTSSAREVAGGSQRPQPVEYRRQDQRADWTTSWSLVGDVNMGFDPYSLQFANGPQSLVDNNGIAGSPAQSANGDSSRAGSIDNTRAYLGVSNKTFGTLTVGRQYAFSNDMANAYDPFGGAYAFSLIGTSATPVGGLGDTEMARYNTSVKYQIAYSGVRAGALVAGRQLAARATGLEQPPISSTLGADYAGFSVDAIYAYANDAVFLKFAERRRHPGRIRSRATTNDLAATLANARQRGVIAGEVQDGRRLPSFAGYDHDRLTNPPSVTPATEAAAASRASRSAILCPIRSQLAPSQATIQTIAYVRPKILQTCCGSARKYGILEQPRLCRRLLSTNGKNNYSTRPRTP